MRHLIWVTIALFLVLGPTAYAQEPTPLPLYALPDTRERTFTSSSLKLDANGRVLVATNMLNNSISFVDVLIPTAAQLIVEVPVGLDPRSVAITPDNALVLVTLRGENSLGVVDFETRAPLPSIALGGALPYAVVSGESGQAFVSLQGSDEVVEVDLVSSQVTRRIPVPDSPAGLALWGDFLYVTHFWSGSLSLIYLPRSEVIDVVSTGPDVGLSQSLDIDVQRSLAYIPQTRRNAHNANPTFDTTVFPVINVVGLRGLMPRTPQRIDPSTADRPVNMPFALVVDPFRNWLYIANAGSNDVSVVDLNSGLARANIPVGANPRGLLLNRDNSYLYVHNVIDGTLTIVETSRLQSVDVLPISTPVISNDILLGAELFHSAADARLSEDRWLSCATCHFDGLPDGRTWQGFDDGPRNTPALYNLIETAPYNWSATWDELQDVELKIRTLQAGTGLIEDFPISEAMGTPHANLSFDLDLLVAYLLSLKPPANPNPSDTAQVERGAALFREQGCDTCHSGAAGTDLQTHDVGTAAAADSRTEFDTPALRYLWLSAPYFHNGSAETLMDVFALPGAHQLTLTLERSDLEALIAYLISWQ